MDIHVLITQLQQVSALCHSLFIYPPPIPQHTHTFWDHLKTISRHLFNQIHFLLYFKVNYSHTLNVYYFEKKRQFPIKYSAISHQTK